MSANSESLIPFRKQRASGGDNPFLPLEIITDILKRVPVKSIVRFRCVCKDWKNLFKTRSFIAEHLHHSNDDKPFLLLHEHNESGHMSSSSLCLINHEMDAVEVLRITSDDWGIIDSCNGLLCVEVGHNRSIWLWNPVIREERELPNTLNDHRYVCSSGFGFSSVVNDYNIVRFYYRELHGKKEDLYFKFIKHDRVEVFSLRTGSWKELESEALQDIEVLPHSFNADGTIFWWGQRPCSRMLISFDIAKEVFTLTPRPTEPTEHSISFGEYENKLEGHYVIEEDPRDDFIIIWRFEEVASESGNSSSCIQQYKIGPVPDVVNPSLIWRDEVVFCEKKKTAVEGEPKCVLHLFNPITDERRKFNCSVDCEWCSVFNYEKSLVSVWNTQEERKGHRGRLEHLALPFFNLMEQ